MSPVYSDFPKLSTPCYPTRQLQVCKCIKLYIKYTLTPSNREDIAWHILMIQDRYVVTSHPVCLKVVKQQTKGERSEECPVGIKRVGIKKHPNFPVSVYHTYSVICWASTSSRHVEAGVGTIEESVSVCLWSCLLWSCQVWGRFLLSYFH